MASSNSRPLSFLTLENTIFNQRRNRQSINTSNAGALPNVQGNRFSFVETPVEMNEHSNRFSLGFHSSIQQSPAFASAQNHPPFEPYADGIEIAPQTPRGHHTFRMDNSHETYNEKSQPRSPYAETHPEPTQIHPAFFAPIDHSAISPQAHHQQPQQPPHSPQPTSYNPPYTQPQTQPQQEQYRAHRTSTLKSESDDIKEQDIRAPLRSPTIPTSNSPREYQQPVFSPGSLAGPNGISPDLHQPGQVVHPNMTFPAVTGEKAEWNHSFLPLTLRTRIRHAYKLQGNIGSDILHSCCCCCCTAIQNEREVAEREDLLRVNAGPAQTQAQYRSSVGQGMVYAPHGGL
ncbi:hypothetical protein EG328_004177 [Venturia inaequalis]|uniref:PLAC8-domain-containing protein n=1 Tax=Venturia inaequalis TaxID=5025 RepID=A0A8H3UNM7_VENIN|nr:hypothetical protein EG328_004177 [Venturia inaequalis]